MSILINSLWAGWLSILLEFWPLNRLEHSCATSNESTRDSAAPVCAFSVCSSKKRGVKRASPLIPIMLGLKMCVLPWGTLIQVHYTQFQVLVRMSPKKVPKMAKISHFWPFLALKPILNMKQSHEIFHTHVLDPNLVVCKKFWTSENF